MRPSRSSLGRGYADLAAIRQRLAPPDALDLVASKPDPWGARQFATRDALLVEEHVLAGVRAGVGVRRALVTMTTREPLLVQVPEPYRERFERILSSRDEVVIVTAADGTVSELERPLQAAGLPVQSVVPVEIGPEFAPARGSVVLLRTGQRLPVGAAGRAVSAVARAGARLVTASGSSRVPTRLPGLLLRRTRTTRARCTVQPEPPSWSQIRTAAKQRQPALALALMERSAQVTEQADPEGALVQWVQKHDGLAVVRDEATARRLNETIRQQVKHGAKVSRYEYVDAVDLTLRERAQGRCYDVGDEVWSRVGST